MSKSKDRRKTQRTKETRKQSIEPRRVRITRRRVFGFLREIRTCPELGGSFVHLKTSSLQPLPLHNAGSLQRTRLCKNPDDAMNNAGNCFESSNEVSELNGNETRCSTWFCSTETGSGEHALLVALSGNELELRIFAFSWVFKYRNTHTHTHKQTHTHTHTHTHNQCQR